MGGAAIGGRLRRLSERIDQDATRVYSQLGITFEQRWFGILNHLMIHREGSVGKIAQTLGITHVSISQARKSLEKEGLIKSSIDPKDGRRKTLHLTDEGEAFVERLAPIWDVFEKAAIELDKESDGVTVALGRLEIALTEKTLYDRVMKMIQNVSSG